MSADVTADAAVAGDAGEGRRGGWFAERPIYGAIIALFSAVLSIAAFTIPEPLRLLETEVNDMLRILAPPKADVQDSRISIAALTEETLVQFPYRSPVDRAFLAELIDALAEAGVKGLVLDILFDQPTEPEKDEALIRALKAFPGPVVAAWGDEGAGLIEAQHDYLHAFEAATGVQLGFANVVTDSDGVVRQFATRLPGIDRLSMSGTMARAVMGEDPMLHGKIDWVIPKDGGQTAFQQFPAHRITQFAKLPPMKPRLKGWLEGRIVFVGADLEQRDRHQTSLSVDATTDRTIPGVVIQAHVLAQLLDKRVVPNASDLVIYAVTGGVALLGVAMGLLRFGLIWKGLGALVLLTGYLGVVYVAAEMKLQFLPVAPPLAAFFVSLSLGVALDSFLTQREEKFIRRAFSHYLEPSMVDQLAADPHALRLGGDRREMSLIFTDIQGFTTMAEELPPDQLTRLLNDYFDGMSDIIFRYGGAIDKFIGDAVVAHFGAPTPMKDHALKALRCAEALDRFAEQFRKDNAHLGLGITRIGVHTGMATVGNFGGRSRFDYTAMGDAVNTCSRLESSNKRFGTRVAVSQEVAELASAMAGPGEALPLLQTIGQVTLRGRSKPVTVYTINIDADEEFVWAYEAAFSLIDIDLDKAKAALHDLFRSNPNDPLVKWHLDRLESGATGTVIGAA